MFAGKITTFVPALCLLATVGCGSGHSAHPTSLEAVELLDVLQEDLKRHDPKAYIELDLGEFRVTRSLGEEGGTLVVGFHLYGVLPEDRQAEFQEKWTKFDKRLRDSVIGLIQRCEQEQITAPRLALVKGELTSSINSLLHTRSLRDVVFSDLTVERH